MKNFIAILIISLIGFVGCTPDDPLDIPIEEDINLGGETTLEGVYVNIFQQPAPNLSPSEVTLHLESDAAFGDIFVTAPSTNNSGLGPVFNQNSCENCHVANGRSPFPTGEDNLRGLLIRLSIPGEDVHGAPNPVPYFGGQLQTKAVFGKTPEAKLTWQEIEEIKKYIDGEEIQLRKFNFEITDPYTSLPNELLFSPRIAPAVFGLGLLEAINESDILALADPNDSNGDGISGKPNRVWDFIAQEKVLGRFGWKAGQPNLLQQTAAAYNQDMGITNPYFSVESSFGQIQADTLADDPEIDNTTLTSATFYPQSLAVPQRRNWDDPSVQSGKKIFFSINCSSCHHPKFITGQHPEFSFLSNQTIYPYTDMLLHDMGEDLADNRPDFEANGQEWRTPPLWGIGLVKTVGGMHANYLHDGRARTLEEAIMWHGGEAENSINAFKSLLKSEREDLIRFLESL